MLTLTYALVSLSGLLVERQQLLVCLCSLLEHCRRHRYLSQSGEELALLLSTLLENLLAYRTITQDESPEHRMSCTVNVLVRRRLERHTHADICVLNVYLLSVIQLLCVSEFLQREEERGHLYSASETEHQCLAPVGCVFLTVCVCVAV